MNPVYQLRDIVTHLPPSTDFIGQNWIYSGDATRKTFLRFPSLVERRLQRAGMLDANPAVRAAEDHLIIQYSGSGQSEAIWVPRWLRARSANRDGIYLNRLVFGVGRLKHPFAIAPTTHLDKSLFSFDEFFHRSLWVPLFLRERGQRNFKSSMLAKYTKFISDVKIIEVGTSPTDNEMVSQQSLRIGTNNRQRIPIYVTPNMFLFSAQELTELPRGVYEVATFTMRSFIESGWYRRVFFGDTVHNSSAVAFDIDAGKVTLKTRTPTSPLNDQSHRIFEMSDIRFPAGCDPKRTYLSCGEPTDRPVASSWMAGCLWRYFAPVFATADITIYSDWRLRVHTETSVAHYEYWLVP